MKNRLIQIFCISLWALFSILMLLKWLQIQSCSQCSIQPQWIPVIGILYFSLLEGGRHMEKVFFLMKRFSGLGLFFAVSLMVVLMTWNASFCLFCFIAHLCHISYWGILVFLQYRTKVLLLMLPIVCVSMGLFSFSRQTIHVNQRVLPALSSKEKGYLLLLTQPGCVFCIEAREILLELKKEGELDNVMYLNSSSSPDEEAEFIVDWQELFGERWWPEGLPTLLLIDQRGIVLKTLVGTSDEYQKEVRHLIEIL